jgi:hypothetical protein
MGPGVDVEYVEWWGVRPYETAAIDIRKAAELRREHEARQNTSGKVAVRGSDNEPGKRAGRVRRTRNE